MSIRNIWLAVLAVLIGLVIVGYFDYQDQVLFKQQQRDLIERKRAALQEKKDKTNALLKRAYEMSNIPAELK